MNRYVFSTSSAEDKLIAAKTFPDEMSVSAEKDFSVVTELCRPLLNQAFSCYVWHHSFKYWHKKGHK